MSFDQRPNPDALLEAVKAEDNHRGHLKIFFGANAGVGFTLQATTARHEDRGIAAAGFSYYPFASGNKFGLPVGVGYQTRNAAALVNYDFLMGNVSVGAGYADTRKDHAPAAAPVVPL